LGSTIRLRFQDDPWENDGAVDMYLIGYSASDNHTLTLDVQDPRRIA
jgi:hypothetical protein